VHGTLKLRKYAPLYLLRFKLEEFHEVIAPVHGRGQVIQEQLGSNAYAKPTKA
jgi:hypothetical protein